MPLTVETPADEQLAELADVKNWLRVDHDADDTLIEGLIRSAHRQIALRTSRSLTLQTLKLTRRDFTCCEMLALPRPPLVEIELVEVYVAGTLVELTEGTDFAVIASGDDAVGGIAPVAGRAWPAIDDRPDAVQVTYVAGSPVEQLPADLITALMLTLAAWYDDRRAGSLPEAAEALLELNRVYDHRVSEALRD